MCAAGRRSSRAFGRSGEEIQDFAAPEDAQIPRGEWKARQERAFFYLLN